MTALSSAARAQSPTEIAGWRLEGLLGEGRWTYVCQARPRDAGPHADYAVKLLKPQYRRDPTAISLLQREARIGSELSHPHLVSVLAAHVDGPPFYLVTPYLEGATLRAALEFAGRLDTPHALWLSRQIADALQAMHRQGWLHTDIKPDNVFVTSTGHVTVFDLGLARNVHASPADIDSLAGTPAYLPPEAFCGKVSWAPASDVYSLGVTLYELLTGRLPFPQQDPNDLIAAIMTQAPPEPRRVVPQIPPRVARLLRHMLAKNPLRRPDIAELIDRLVDLEIDTFDERLSA